MWGKAGKLRWLSKLQLCPVILAIILATFAVFQVKVCAMCVWGVAGCVAVGACGVGPVLSAVSQCLWL
jgi:hypothetical protein